jgi:hypothetical protein
LPDTGNLAGGISFSRGDVSRVEVVALFGEPVQIISRPTGTTESFRKQIDAVWAAWKDGRPFECLYSGDTAILYYPTNGIAFLIGRAVIEEIRVFPPDMPGS